MELKKIEDEDFDIRKIPTMGKKLNTIFQYNPDINKTSYLNWRTRLARSPRRQFVVIGEAYFSTAYNLIQQCLIDNNDKKADSWIFPIMFNIVHANEVYLKAINAELSIILNEDRGMSEGGHDLRALCINARKLIIKYKNKTSNKNTIADQMFQGIKIVERFIDNIYEKTYDMTFARYPLAMKKKEKEKKEEGHFYINTFENEVIDLESLAEQVVYVYKMLDFIYKTIETDL